MTLTEAFKELVQTKYRPSVVDITLTNKEEQIEELLEFIGNDQSVKGLYILEVPQTELEKLLREKDMTVSTSAAYTILNNSLTEFELSKYV